MEEEIKKEASQVQGNGELTSLVVAMANQMLAMQNQLNQMIQKKSSNGGRGRTAGKRCFDTKTGKVHSSHAAAGMAVAPELKLPVHNYVWYEVIRLDGNRFVDVESDAHLEQLKKQYQTNQEKVAQKGK